MFIPIKSDNGAVLPWEYLAAEAGTYKAGQLMNVDASTGHVEPISTEQTTTPPYLCMADVTVADAGTPIPVTRVSKDHIYETTLAAAASGTVTGSKLQVASGGLQATAGAGTFEVVSLDGIEAGDILRGRWQ